MGMDGEVGDQVNWNLSNQIEGNEIGMGGEAGD